MNRHALATVATAALTLSLLVGCSSDEQSASSPDVFCEQLAPLADLGGQLQTTDADLAGLAQQVNGLVAVAPVAVRPSVETIASALATMASAAEASGEEGPAALAAAFAAIEGDREALERASEVVEGYANRECGFNLSPDSSEVTDPTSTDTTASG